MRCARSIATYLLASLFARSEVYADDLLRHQRQALPEATHYQGITNQNGRKIRFQTRSDYILLDHSVPLVEVRAIDRRKRATGPLATTTVVLGAPKMQVELPISLAPQPPPTTVIEAPFEPWPTGETSVKSLNYGAIGMGLGSEAITAQAGVSEFAGEATTGTTWLRIKHQPEAARWLFQEHLAAHRFTTNLVETIA